MSADRDGAFALALAAEKRGDRAMAEASYQLLLVRNPADDEARYRLGLLLARRGHLKSAELELSIVLTRRPTDVDARAALIDVYLWSRRFDDAERQISIGLAQKPDQPELLTRKARLSLFRGDRSTAQQIADSAEALAPNDEDIRTLRDRLYLGEARLILRNQFFPAGWDNLPSTELLLSQRVSRFTLGLRTEQSQRTAIVSTNRSYNAFYAASVAYDIAPGWMFGAEGGLGSPAPAVAKYLMRGFLYFPIYAPFDGYAAYGYWTYETGTTVNMVNPAIGVQLLENLRLEAKYWWARVAADTATAGRVNSNTSSFGAYAIFRPRPRVAVDLLYVYGTQLDRLPVTFQLADVRSHILATSVDLLIVRNFGLRPLYGVEIRRNPNGLVIDIHTAELAAYARW